MKRTNLKVGDVFVIPLPDGRKAYGQFVFWDDRKPYGLGFLVQIFDLITEVEVPVEQLRSTRPLFPPVFVGLRASIRSGRWRVVGRLPVEGFVFPKFRWTNGGKPGIYHDWKIWDGEQVVFVGDLPPEYRSLELFCVWGDELLEDRIATGVNPFDKVM
ncbi:MAG: immunity 26/phosphotriesterase HocA family protein [Firmicutes bacterium]|nr:immunity 26/phosphotriesterase HocA family protein [Bacillota bacterium]